MDTWRHVDEMPAARADTAPGRLAAELPTLSFEGVYMRTLSAILDVVLKTIMVVSAASVLIVSTLQIISRFITQLPIGWSMDVLRMSFIYAVFSGAA